MVAKAGYQERGEDVGTSNKAGGESQRGNLKEGGTPRLGGSQRSQRLNSSEACFF